MTHRRRTGVVVIGVVVVLMVVVTGLRPHLLGGAAQAAPVPGPPAVGDCVLDPLPGSPQNTAVTAASGGAVPVYPQQLIRPCTAARYGEIVFVIAAPKPAVVEGEASGRFLADPNMDSCFQAAMRYLGIPTQPMVGTWQTFLQITVALSRPSPRQQADGQRWAACIVGLQAPGGSPNSADDQQYGSSIRDALHTGRERNQLAECGPTLDWNADLVAGNCGHPHSVEILAFADSGDHRVNRTQFELTCQQLVRRLTAMPDPTAGGALSIQIHVQDMNNTASTTTEIPAHSTLLCGVVASGTRKLGGSLVALGRQPIPWA